jgi:hypothetical protein
VARYFDNIEGESRYQEAQYSIEFGAKNGPKSLEIRSSAELHWLCYMSTKKDIMAPNGQFFVVLRRGPTGYTKYGLSAHWVINKSPL